MPMFNNISCGTEDNERECLANAKVVSQNAKKFGIGQWSFTGPGSEKKWHILCKRTVHKEFGTISRKRCCWNSQRVDVKFSVLRTLLSRNTRSRPPMLKPVLSQAIHSRAFLNLHHCDIQSTAQKSPSVNTFGSHLGKKRDVFYSLGAWDWWSGHANTGAGQEDTSQTKAQIWGKRDD